MRMRQLKDGLEVPAGGEVTLKPGSFHVMLMDLKQPLQAGDKVPLTLTFAGAAAMTFGAAFDVGGAGEENFVGHSRFLSEVAIVSVLIGCEVIREFAPWSQAHTIKSCAI